MYRAVSTIVRLSALPPGGRRLAVALPCQTPKTAQFQGKAYRGGWQVAAERLPSWINNATMILPGGWVIGEAGPPDAWGIEMSKTELLIHELQQAPEPMLDEVLDFVRFLKLKQAGDRLDTAIASESALAKDWLAPEEDAAWQGL
jgi:hypothetical protein